MKDIALISMSCRLPGANDIDQFWKNLILNKTSITELNDEELIENSIKPNQFNQNNYVKKAGIIDQIDMFDAEFFDYSPKEASLIDPQSRILLELSWQALENAGYLGIIDKKSIGVYASAGFNNYLLKNILTNQEEYSSNFQEVIINNAADCLATRISYKLGLCGPSLTIQSGCSSSLVALHHARIALLTQQCDAAIVGACAINIPQKIGYSYIPGGILSREGICSPFSETADGTVFSSGAVVVVLKRLEDARKHGNKIYAIVKSSAINNDGNNKAGFTAPSVQGQSEVILKAQRISGISPDNIQYIEAHGTGTLLGDPIEVEALTKAYRIGTEKTNFCGIGSVKANIGHVDVTAGLAGLLKTALALENEVIPATINYSHPNSKIDFENSPFYVCSKNHSWIRSNKPRYAAVSSFGFGGTNAHIILEEAPLADSLELANTPQLFILSTKTEDKLEKVAKELEKFILNSKNLSLQNIAYTLQLARYPFKFRTGFIADSIEQVLICLRKIIAKQPLIASDKSNLNQYLQCWLKGDNPDFSNLHQGNNLKFINLPNYPFQRKRHWIEAKESKKEKGKDLLLRHDNIEDMIFQTVWQQATIPQKQSIPEYIIFFLLPNSGAEQLAKMLEIMGSKVVFVYREKKFEQVNKSCFNIGDDKTHYTELFEILNQEKTSLHIVYAWGETEHHNMEIFYSLLNLFQTVISKAVNCKQLDIITENSNDILGVECLNPVSTSLYALSRSFTQEYPNIKSRCIDITSVTPIVIPEIIKELSDTGSHDDIVAFRGKHKWRQSYQLANEKLTSSNSFFENKGVYIVIGGLGNVGMVHVEYLAKTYNAKLILVGRTAYPKKESWDFIIKNNDKKDTTIIEKLKALVNLIKLGADIDIVNADITQLTELDSVFQFAIHAYGKIDGVIHAAGSKGDLHYKPILEITPEYCSQIFDSKIIGVQHIDKLAEKYHVKICLVISSISSVLAGLGLGIYAASHNYINTYAHLANRKNKTQWHIINWEAWDFHKKSGVNKTLGAIGSSIDQFTIDPVEGTAILDYLSWRLNGAEYTVSTCDLFLRHQYWVRKDFKTNKKIHLSERPLVSTDYVKPTTALQHEILLVWSDLLGISSIGICDNFFELGGHSLMALEMVSIINKKSIAELSIIDLFASPTIEKLAQFLSKTMNENQLENRIQKRALAQQKALKIN